MSVSGGSFVPWRARMLSLLLGIAGLLLIVRLVELQIYKGPFLQEAADRQSAGILKIPGPRGEIVDRRGRLLAVSVPVSILAVEPYKIKSRNALRALERASHSTADLVGRADARWIPAQRNCDSACRQRVEALIENGTIPKHAVHWAPGYRRHYPHGRLASHVLGFVTLDGKNAEGIEGYANETISSPMTILPRSRDAHRGDFEPLDSTGATHVEPTRLMLTLDVRLQAALEEVLSETLHKHDAASGRGIILDPHTGDVLAMASKPDFDPNEYWKYGKALGNSNVLDADEPGSVIKPAIAAGLLDAGVARLEDRVDCEKGRWKSEYGVITDTHPHDFLTLREVIERSSNIGISKLSKRLDPGSLYEILRRFGFGRKTGIDLPGETAGVLRPPERWQGRDNYAITFGHAMQATMVQIARMYAALAMDGLQPKPRVVRAWGEMPAGIWREIPIAPKERVVSSKTARAITRALTGVTEAERCTGSLAKIPGFVVAGKTGTPELVVDKKYDRKANRATFAGFAPADDPVAVVVISIDRPKRNGVTAGKVAAPAFAKVMQETLRLARFPAQIARAMETRR